MQTPRVNEERERVAWVETPSEAEMRARLRLRFPDKDMRHPYDFGFLPAMSRLAGAHERIAAPLSALFAEIMFAPGHLSRAEREMIAAVTAAAQDCYY